MNYRLKGNEATELGTDLVVYKSDHEYIINNIENRVNEALNKIKDIRGIDVIEECVVILDGLTRDLY